MTNEKLKKYTEWLWNTEKYDTGWAWLGVILLGIVIYGLVVKWL